MQRMRFKAIGLIACCCQLLLAWTGVADAELEFYQDVEPKLTPEVKLERLVRFLEAKSGHHAGSSDGLRLHHQPLEPHQPPLNSHHHLAPQSLAMQQEQELEELEELEMQRKQQEQAAAAAAAAAALHRKQQQQLYRKQQQHLLDLARQKQRGLLRDDLPERPNIIDVLQRQAADPLEYVRELERQRLLPYLEYEPPRIKQYSVEDEARARLLPQLNKDPMLDYPETPQYPPELGQRARQLQESARLAQQVAGGLHRHRPAFTYTFERAPQPRPRDDEAPPFAVGPNDPRFYEEDPPDETDPADEPHSAELQHHSAPLIQQGPSSSSDDDEPVAEPILVGSTSKPARPTHKPKPRHEHEHAHEQQLQHRGGGNRPREGDELVLARAGVVEMSMMPEPQRRAEQDPLVVSLDHKVNSDIYFIAIVAGCSAAAMFALVLISLTWCRLQRVSKAAADVEYPAYGVTGPNKDISPSGDQRLAQSAQMYHFQHQKQQIIAMENRVSATRDPGSVSEAESDEENEEGDYTVYECPGLAPTGEMEVKNPLFHDDPTPATPAKSCKKNHDDDDV